MERNVIALTTTADQIELLKAKTAKGKLKDLLEYEQFTIDEIVFFVPDELENEGRMNVSIKVNGKYFRGISNRVVDTLATLATWEKQNEENQISSLKFHMEKTAGKYGTFDLIIDG